MKPKGMESRLFSRTIENSFKVPETVFCFARSITFLRRNCNPVKYYQQCAGDLGLSRIFKNEKVLDWEQGFNYISNIHPSFPKKLCMTRMGKDDACTLLAPNLVIRMNENNLGCGIISKNHTSQSLYNLHPETGMER